ncbi:hypothetical protein ACROYT_G014486 [Oculina patagonica]
MTPLWRQKKISKCKKKIPAVQGKKSAESSELELEVTEESNFEEGSSEVALATAAEFCAAVSDEREKLEAWRSEKEVQDRE